WLMATLSFEGETHGELVVKVRRWLASLEGEDAGHITPADAVEQGAELTKEALRIIAAAAPEPVAQSEVVKALTNAGYEATAATKESPRWSPRARPTRSLPRASPSTTSCSYRRPATCSPTTSRPPRSWCRASPSPYRSCRPRWTRSPRLGWPSPWPAPAGSA